MDVDDATVTFVMGKKFSLIWITSQVVVNKLSIHRKKIQVQLTAVKKWKVPGKLYNYGKTPNLEEKKRFTKDHGGFQQQSPQRLVDINEHVDSQNDRQMMRLNAISVEYYLMR